ncbi:hypothetical protein H696_02158 [Fonticula alba]|uniref:ESCRT-II complex subunit VPS25 n=1 Tax=Fonticula alba TaxID=691883 RepID=A0A058ZCP3_FONAL|nr:hypothetical protein H696_02158 [Fonticula alba]KCV71207.1 hypothetical protein H696_02158 [Fonticula alba]|eukprot:XP_009494330.1 hypothetical protein H696_02158 [Fonticula alba]
MMAKPAAAPGAESADFPAIYNFPPFFTLQPNQDTRSRQLDTWTQLILSHTAPASGTVGSLKQRLATADLFNARDVPFVNSNIGRKISPELGRAILDHMLERGNAIPCPSATMVPAPAGAKQQAGTRATSSPSSPGNSGTFSGTFYSHLLILHRSAFEWADLIERYAAEVGLRDTVLTLEEFLLGRETEDQPFHGMDRTFFKTVVAPELGRRNRVILFGSDDEEGLKFV